jgi:23S rRNA (uracil1939-C5)-methyltransferase
MDEPAAVGARLDLTTTAMVAGGASLARDHDGRVVFVAGALPGERVLAEVTEVHKDFARAQAVEVVDPSADRVEPPCPHVARGCGGCDLQHARASAQPGLKRSVVVDALTRIGRMPDAEDLVRSGPPLASVAYRTSVRGAVVDGRFGFRARRSHQVVDVDRCLVAHPLADDLIERGRFGGAEEVTIRVGASTGERLALVAPDAHSVDLPDDVVVVALDAVDEHLAPWIHEVVGGSRLRITATSFFQARSDGAEALVDAVRELGGHELGSAGHVVDAFGGVGMLAATAVPASTRVSVVEWNRSSVADARVNLDGRDHTVIRCDVARWRPEPADVVIADPSRTGLGRRAAERLAAAEPAVVVLVSCDAAALARDTTLLVGHGYRLAEAQVLDLFPHTHHVEVVSRFVRERPA